MSSLRYLALQELASEEKKIGHYNGKKITFRMFGSNVFTGRTIREWLMMRLTKA